MTNNFSNVMDYKVVADNVNKFNEEMKQYVMEDYNDAISSAKDFADAYGDDCVENPYLCGTMDYDYDIREMWADFAWHGDVCDTFKDARDFYDEHKDMFISMEDIDKLVEGLDGTDDVENGECLVWVKNPYYVDTDNNNDNEWSDRDWLIKRTADTIKDYLGNYMPSYLDQFGDCVITVYWDEFDEDMMKNMIEDDNFALQVKSLVYGVDGIKDMLVYDDGVYVSVDVKKFDKVA